MEAGILSDIRVIDFTHIFAGPFATQILGDLGADVIKIERIDGGDAARSYGLEEDGNQLSGPFLALNRNKRSVALDLSTDEGRAVAKDLILSADVVVENFRDGVMKRFELDYDSVTGDRPDIIYCRVTGFGHEGPLSTKAANDLIVQAYSGLLSFTGEPERPPVRCGTAISDFSAGLYAALGVLGALLHRSVSGAGQLVQTSLLESQVSMMSYFFSEYWLQGIVPQPMGTSNRLGMPNQAFPTRDGYVVITAANERMWQRCCNGLGDPDLAFDSRFATLADRYRNRSEVEQRLSVLTSTMSTAECVAALEEQGVSCAPINTVADVANDEQLAELGAFADIPAGSAGKAQVVGNPLHFSQTPWSVSKGAPDVGQHSIEVLRELGYPTTRIDELLAARTISRGGHRR